MEPFDKHEYYRRAVQDPEAALAFLRGRFRDAFGREPRMFREDFCGSGALSAEWVGGGGERKAVGIDNHRPTLAYARRRWGTDRLTWLERDILAQKLPSADIACALNFSYAIFHERADLRRYFEQCRAAAGKQGLFAIDCLPGIEVAGGVETEVHYDDFSYSWEQVSFEPITRRARFAIHFQRPNEPRRERVFTYDWRLWTVPELRDLLLECGFRSVDVYYGGGDAEESSGSMSILLVAVTSSSSPKSTSSTSRRRKPPTAKRR